jgi:Cu/Ag efflux protein CusF
VFTSVCPAAFAGQAKAGKPGSEMKLTSIDLANNKITVSDPDGNDIKTLTVMQVTKVTVNGQPAKLSDLKRGMRVNLSVSQGGKVADKIDATDASGKK